MTCSLCPFACCAHAYLPADGEPQLPVCSWMPVPRPEPGDDTCEPACPPARHAQGMRELQSALAAAQERAQALEAQLQAASSAGAESSSGLAAELQAKGAALEEAEKRAAKLQSQLAVGKQKFGEQVRASGPGPGGSVGVEC